VRNPSVQEQCKLLF